jgi:hypothetical protein
VTKLPAEALDIENCQTKDLNFRQGLFDSFKFVGLDDRNNQFHRIRL